ncbi:MAG: ribosomal protein L7/L12 [Planctomycetota bacterium]
MAALTRAGAQATVVEAGAGAADEQEADAIWDDDSSAASGPAAAAGAGVAAGGAPTACELVVLDAGRNKIATIKAIRELTGWGLAEAKGCADRAGSVVLRGPRAQLAAGLAKLQSAGARGEIRGA